MIDSTFDLPTQDCLSEVSRQTYLHKNIRFSIVKNPRISTKNRMRKYFLLPAFSLVALVTSNSASAATLVVGFDWTASSTSNKLGTGITVSNLSATGLSQSTTSNQSSTGLTWGSASLGINPDTAAGRIRASTGSDAVLEFRVTNNSGSSLQLSQWHLNSWGSAGGVVANVRLDYLGTGPIGMGGAFGNSDIAGIPTNSAPGDRSFTAFDSSISFGDNLLDNGEFAAFRLTLAGEASQTGGFTAFDNFAISAVPEPSSSALIAGGIALLTLVNRRRS